MQNARGFFLFRSLQYYAMFMVPGFLQQLFYDWKLKPLHLDEYDFFENLSRHLIRERRAEGAVGSTGCSKFNDMVQLMVSAEHSVDGLKKTYKENLSEDVIDGKYMNAGSEEFAQEEKELKDIIGTKYLSEEEIAAQAMVFFLAGYETTGSTLFHTLFELTVNPDVQERLYQEIQKAKITDPTLNYTKTLSKIDYLDAVISETLRMYPPDVHLNRQAAEPYYIPEIKCTIEKNTPIYIPVYSIHHNEEYYPDPERFDPERFMPENRHKIFPYSYLPFGAGPRGCIGVRFVLTEVKISMVRILERFQLLKVPDVTTDKLKILPGSGIIKTSAIKIAVKRR